MKNASAFGSSKNQMLPSLLPLPASFVKVLPLPQKFNRFHRFRFHIPVLNKLTSNILYKCLEQSIITNKMSSSGYL